MNRNYQLDILRIVSAYMVVLLHVAAQGFYMFSEGWGIALIYNSLSRVAVPIMFMISGALLIPKQETLLKWIRRVLKRIIIPYIFYSAIYLLFQYKASGSIETLNIFLKSPYYHLPFMLQYLGFQLTLPVLRGFWNSNNTSNYAKIYVIALTLFYGCLKEFIEPLLGQSIIGFSCSFFPYYIGMALLGAYCSEKCVQGGDDCLRI